MFCLSRNEQIWLIRNVADVDIMSIRVIPAGVLPKNAASACKRFISTTEF